MTDTAAPARDLAALTSLRFFAALAVLLYHVPYVLPRSVGWTILPNGSLGVSFFFILSGFVLTHVYHGTAFTARGFYLKRFARIYPLHIATFLLWCALYLKSWGGVTHADILRSGAMNVLLLQAFATKELYWLGFNAVSWTLSVEAFFYLLFPLLIRGRNAWVVFALYVVAFALLPKSAHDALERVMPECFYFNPVARLLEFSGGMTLYALYLRYRPSFAVASLLQCAGVAALPFCVKAAAPLSDQLHNLALFLPFALIISACAHDGLVTRLLSLRALVVLGESSFALYMLHHMFMHGVDGSFARLALTPALSLTLAIVLSTLLAVLTHYLFERPMRAWVTERFGARRPVTPCG